MHFFLLPLPLLIYFLVPPLRQQKTFMSVPFFKNFIEATGISGKTGVSVSKKKVINIITLGIIWILFVGALASPRLVGEPEQKIKTASSLMFAVDLSGREAVLSVQDSSPGRRELNALYTLRGCHDK